MNKKKEEKEQNTKVKEENIKESEFDIKKEEEQKKTELIVTPVIPAKAPAAKVSFLR